MKIIVTFSSKFCCNKLREPLEQHSDQNSFSDKCKSCNECVKVCPQPEVIEPVIGKGGKVSKNFLLCLRCVDACPEKDFITLNKK